jgi:hypothetical protein
VFTSYSGNIGVSIPAGALAEIKTRSLHDDSHQESRAHPQTNKQGKQSVLRIWQRSYSSIFVAVDTREYSGAAPPNAKRDCFGVRSRS